MPPIWLPHGVGPGEDDSKIRRGEGKDFAGTPRGFKPAVPHEVKLVNGLYKAVPVPQDEVVVRSVERREIVATPRPTVRSGYTPPIRRNTA